MPKLTVLQVKNAKPGRHSDGDGLQLLVRAGGSRSWVLRTQVDGKRQDIGLGSCSCVSLAQARSRAPEFRTKLKNGEAPRPTPKKVELPAEMPVPSFAAAARSCHQAIKGGWSNKHHSDSWLASLETHIFPFLGTTPVDKITSAMVREAFVPIWLSIPETARRILQRVRTVLDFAHIEGWCQHEASLRSVTKGLPRQPVIENHYVAMRYEDIPAFFTLLSGLPVTPARDALMFTILNGVRSGECRLAKWPEFDLGASVWNIPASRMKMRKPHSIPLTPAAISILKRRWEFRGEDDGWVFSSSGKSPLSDMTMTKVLRDLKFKKETVHGFRSTFTDWAAETTDHPKEVVDKALAHQLLDRVEAAYRRTDFFERRRRLMLDWAMFARSGDSPAIAHSCNRERDRF